MPDTHFDTIVVGGGPAGCAAATLLAQKGRKVLLLEKEKMPRYHIGESLMPYCYFTLEKLGVLEQMKKHEFIQKLSVQFVSQDGTQSRPFYFFQHKDHPSSWTWQVERAEFDEMLFENAKTHGVDARQEVKVTQFVQDESGAVTGVVAEDVEGRKATFYAPITMDCTGRDAMWASKNQWREKDPKLNRIALWTYYQDARRDPGLDAGSTTVAYIPGKGWFWYIPLKDNVTSVGIVAERSYLYRDGERDLAKIFEREIRENVWIAEHLAPGRQFGRHWVTGEFSYRSRHCAADGLVMAGDSFVFLDPVFSSGVFLAFKSAEGAVEAVEIALKTGRHTAEMFDGYGAVMCKHIETMRKIVYAFYDPKFSFGGLIKDSPDVRGPLTDCLIGHVEQDFESLFDAIRKIADLPAELSYGQTGARSQVAAI